MNNQIELQPKKFSIEAFNDLIIDSIQDIKGQNIVQLDLRHIEDSPTDFFIICDGNSNTQVKAIANNIFKRIREEVNEKPRNLEGMQSGKWVCLDYLSTVVHVFYNETRRFYDLERLWSDAKFTEYDSL